MNNDNDSCMTICMTKCRVGFATAQVGIMQLSKFKPGTVQENSSTIDRSSGRDQTDAFMMTVQCSEALSKSESEHWVHT